MEKVQILLYALASFFSTENPPILAKSAKIEINLATKQIILHQYDVVTVPQYADNAEAALEALLNAPVFVQDLEPLLLTSKYFYEEDGKLNVTIYFQYNDVKDLRRISMYLNVEEKTLSYPYMDSFEYTAPDAVFDERFVRFDVDDSLELGMAMKETPELNETVSLLSEWKKIEAKKYVDISGIFSKKDFEKLRKFIFKNGDIRTFRNFDNNNPHYRFDDFDVYLGTGDQRSVFENDKLKPEDYTELVIGFSRVFMLYVTPHNPLNLAMPNLENGKVYWHNQTNQDQTLLKECLAKIISGIN